MTQNELIKDVKSKNNLSNIMLFIKGGSNILADLQKHFAGFDIVYEICQKIIYRLKTFSLGFYTNERLGEISTIIHKDVDNMEMVVGHMWTRIYFAPYAFDSSIQNYGIYVDKNNFNSKDGTAFADKDDYLKKEWYIEAIQNNKVAISKPYKYSGIHIITVSVPLMSKEKAVGVVLMDINIDEFKNIKVYDEEYPTMFAGVINNHGEFIFHSKDDRASGQAMKARFPVAKQYQQLLEYMEKGENFTIEVTSPEGEQFLDYFVPVSVGEDTWWTYTALERKDFMHDVYRLSGFMILASVLAVIILIVVTTSLRSSLHHLFSGRYPLSLY